MHVLNSFQRGLDFDRVYSKGGPLPPYEADPRRLRVLSWNIAHGHAPDRIAAVLKRVAPDIACLQEVDWCDRRSGLRDVLADLAAATGMLGFYTVEFLALASAGGSGRRQGGGAIGNALLTRLTPHQVSRIDMPVAFDWENAVRNPCLPLWIRWVVGREPRLGRRCGIVAEFTVGGRNAVVASVHLENKQCGIAGRWSQYKAALDRVADRAGTGAACVIAGDFNTFDCALSRIYTREDDAAALSKPGSMAEAAWWKHTLLPPTGYADPFPADTETFRVTPFFRPKLDWITVRGAATHNHAVGPFASSDHRPVWADLDLASG